MHVRTDCRSWLVGIRYVVSTATTTGSWCSMINISVHASKIEFILMWKVWSTFHEHAANFFTIIVIVNQIKYTSRCSKQIGKAGVGFGQSVQTSLYQGYAWLRFSSFLGQKVFLLTLFNQLARKTR
jgi:hypothetical protein